MTGLTLLVVDDEPDLRELLKDEFEMQGSRVLEAESGEAALSQLRKHRVDAVISDVRMPGGSGMELLRRFVRELPTLPNAGKMPVFILLTGFADVEDAEARALGASALIQKPFDLKALREIVRACLVRER